MKKFLKKNKLPLFLLACVVSLSVFYVFAPENDNEATAEVINIEEDTSYVYFNEERLDILEARNEYVLSVEEEIATSSFDAYEVKDKIALIDVVYNITKKEISLEAEIESLGYKDCLVYQYDSVISENNAVLKNVDIKILATEITKERCVVITQLAKTKFGSNDYKVSVILESD